MSTMYFKVHTIYTLSLLVIFMQDLLNLSQASGEANGMLHCCFKRLRKLGFFYENFLEASKIQLILNKKLF